MTYTLIEYVDSTFATAKQMEQGVGALTLGGSISACTLARTTPRSTATSMNGTPTYATGAPSAISIGTAANTLLLIGASAADLPAYSPYYESSLGDAVGVVIGGYYSSLVTSDPFLFPASGDDNYFLFEWRVPMLVKRATVWVAGAGTGNTNMDGRLYEIGSNGRPGKLLYDFGLFGSANTSLSSTGKVSTGAAGSGFMLLPGEYFFDLMATYGGSPTLSGFNDNNNATSPPPYIGGGRMGSSSGLPQSAAKATSGAIGSAPDPANVTSYALNGSCNAVPFIALNAS